MIAEGQRVKDVAASLGVTRQTVSTWQSEERMRERVAAEARAVESARTAGIEAAKRLLQDAAPVAARVLTELAARAVEPGEEQAAKVQLAAVIAVLDRTGLPKASEVAVTGKDGGPLLVDAVEAALARAGEGGEHG